MADSDSKQANLMIDLMRRVDRIEQGTCTSDCLKELGLLALRLSAMKSGMPFHELLYALVDETLHVELEPSKATRAAIVLGTGN